MRALPVNLKVWLVKSEEDSEQLPFMLGLWRERLRAQVSSMGVKGEDSISILFSIMEKLIFDLFNSCGLYR
jgi:hypothetical protein